MTYPHSRQSESDSDPISESAVGSNERTNERTYASDGSGRQSGAGSRRTGAYADSQQLTSPTSQADDGKPRRSHHSEQVAYYVERAREAIRQASAEHHKRDVPEPAPVAVRGEGGDETTEEDE